MPGPAFSLDEPENGVQKRWQPAAGIGELMCGWMMAAVELELPPLARMSDAPLELDPAAAPAAAAAVVAADVAAAVLPPAPVVPAAVIPPAAAVVPAAVLALAAAHWASDLTLGSTCVL